MDKIDFQHLVKEIYLSNFFFSKGYPPINLLYISLLYRTQVKKGMGMQQREDGEHRKGGKKKPAQSFWLFLYSMMLICYASCKIIYNFIRGFLPFIHLCCHHPPLGGGLGTSLCHVLSFYFFMSSHQQYAHFLVWRLRTPWLTCEQSSRWFRWGLQLKSTQQVDKLSFFHC